MPQKDLNKPESKLDLVARLKKEANGHEVGYSIVDALEFRREQYGLSAMVFASILGMRRSHYSEFVHGKRDLTMQAARRAFAIGVPAKALLQPNKLAIDHDQQKES